MKNDCLNACKAVAAFFVIFIHCSFPSPAGGMMNGLARFAVPLFFMISGYFCFGRGAKVVERRSRRTFQLFLTGNGVYFLWKLLFLAIEGELTAAAAADLFSPAALAKWLFLNKSPFMAHLWFLGALLYCYLFFLLLLRFHRQDGVYFLIPVCLGLNLVLGVVLPAMGRDINFLAVRNFWLTGLPFFLWGHWFHRKQEWVCKRMKAVSCVLAVGAGACLSMAELLLTGGAELYFGSVLMAGGIFVLALKFPEWGKGGCLARIGEKDSLNIYLWHMLLFDITAAAAYSLGIKTHPVYQWLMPLWICLLSWAAAEFVRKLKEN